MNLTDFRATSDGLRLDIDVSEGLTGQLQLGTRQARKIALAILAAQAEHLYFVPPNPTMRERTPAG